MTATARATLIAVAAALLGSIGCSGPGAAPAAPASSAPRASAAPATAAPPAAGAPDPQAIIAAYTTDAFVKINATGINGTGPHTAGQPLFVYVDKAHAALYKKAVKGPMPEGTTIVKVSAEGPQKIFAIMKKLKPGTDPGAADWFFWEQLGSSVPFDGNAVKGGGLCFSCHKGAPANADSLLGTDVFGL